MIALGFKICLITGLWAITLFSMLDVAQALKKSEATENINYVNRDDNSEAIKHWCKQALLNNSFLIAENNIRTAKAKVICSYENARVD